MHATDHIYLVQGKETCIGEGGHQQFLCVPFIISTVRQSSPSADMNDVNKTTEFSKVKIKERKEMKRQGEHKNDSYIFQIICVRSVYRDEQTEVK